MAAILAQDSTGIMDKFECFVVLVHLLGAWNQKPGTLNALTVAFMTPATGANSVPLPVGATESQGVTDR